METSGALEHLLWQFFQTDLVKRSVSSVIHHSRLSRISTILIVVNPETGILTVIIYQKIIAYSAETYLIFCIDSECIVRQLGDNACAKPQNRNSRHDIELCTANLLLKCLPTDDPFIIRRG